MKMTALKTSAAASEGRWVKDIPGMEDIELLVRGTSNLDYRRRMQALVRALPPSQKKKGNVDTAAMDRITGICLADHALLDWKNVEDADGKPLPFSKEKALEILTDPQFGAFRDGVFLAASEVEHEDGEANDETEKNSGAPSATV